jgi:HSP20 family protein
MNQLQREINSLFSSYDSPRLQSAPSYPSLNIWADEESVMVTAELPGVKAEDLDISVEGGSLTLSGVREPVELPDNGQVHRHERSHGKFTRNINLPFEVEVDQVEASLKNGVLLLRLPRAEEDKPKKITIQS